MDSDSDSCGFGFELAGFGPGFGFEMPGFAHHWLRCSKYFLYGDLGLLRGASLCGCLCV